MPSLTYLDTSAWNAVLDADTVARSKAFGGQELLFSSCNLDEFCLAKPKRAAKLAALAWEYSNRRKLLDHVELSHAEILCYLSNNPMDSYYDELSPQFIQGWGLLMRGLMPEEMLWLLQEEGLQAKKRFRDHLRGMRKMFNPVFAPFVGTDIVPSWPKMLDELYEEGYVAGMLWNSIRAPDAPRLPVEQEAFLAIPFRQLPATAAHAEYLLAMSFLGSYRSGDLSKPDLGDQVDFRHAAYAGIVDTFVTGDVRMHHILSEMVQTKRAAILKIEDYLVR